MQLTIADPRVSDTMNGFLVVANIINLIYNVPQMMQTYRTKSTKDFSTWFIFLRIIGNTIWISYAINIDSLQMLINNCVSVFASLFISYYKCGELYAEYVDNRNNHLLKDYNLIIDDTLLENGEVPTEEISLS
jgi:uncharacterized protein with PQ loop repeat